MWRVFLFYCCSAFVITRTYSARHNSKSDFYLLKQPPIEFDPFVEKLNSNEPKAYHPYYEQVHVPHKGTCSADYVKCDKPLSYDETFDFECHFDDECAALYKCCEDSCFTHKICKKISEAIDIKTDTSTTANPTTKPVKCQTDPEDLSSQKYFSTEATTQSSTTTFESSDYAEVPTSNDISTTIIHSTSLVPSLYTTEYSNGYVSTITNEDITRTTASTSILGEETTSSTLEWRPSYTTTFNEDSTSTAGYFDTSTVVPSLHTTLYPSEESSTSESAFMTSSRYIPSTSTHRYISSGTGELSSTMIFSSSTNRDLEDRSTFSTWSINTSPSLTTEYWRTTTHFAISPTHTTKFTDYTRTTKGSSYEITTTQRDPSEMTDTTAYTDLFSTESTKSSMYGESSTTESPFRTSTITPSTTTDQHISSTTGEPSRSTMIFSSSANRELEDSYSGITASNSPSLTTEYQSDTTTDFSVLPTYTTTFNDDTRTTKASSFEITTTRRDPSDMTETTAYTDLFSTKSSMYGQSSTTESPFITSTRPTITPSTTTDHHISSSTGESSRSTILYSSSTNEELEDSTSPLTSTFNGITSSTTWSINTSPSPTTEYQSGTTTEISVLPTYTTAFNDETTTTVEATFEGTTTRYNDITETTADTAVFSTKTITPSIYGESSSSTQNPTGTTSYYEEQSRSTLLNGKLTTENFTRSESSTTSVNLEVSDHDYLQTTTPMYEVLTTLTTMEPIKPTSTEAASTTYEELPVPTSIQNEYSSSYYIEHSSTDITTKFITSTPSGLSENSTDTGNHTESTPEQLFIDNETYTDFGSIIEAEGHVYIEESTTSTGEFSTTQKITNVSITDLLSTVDTSSEVPSPSTTIVREISTTEDKISTTSANIILNSTSEKSEIPSSGTTSTESSTQEQVAIATTNIILGISDPVVALVTSTEVPLMNSTVSNVNLSSVDVIIDDGLTGNVSEDSTIRIDEMLTTGTTSTRVPPIIIGEIDKNLTIVVAAPNEDKEYTDIHDIEGKPDMDEELEGSGSGSGYNPHDDEDSDDDDPEYSGNDKEA